MTAPPLSRTSRRLILAFLQAAAALWLSVLVLAPWVVAHRPPNEPVVRLAATVYVAGGLVCHQRPSRSFHLWSTRLPVCARCCGLYAGAFSGLLVAALWPPSKRTRPRIDDQDLRRWRRLVLWAAAPTVIIFFLEHAGLLPAVTTNRTRAVCGLLLGGVVAWIFRVSLRSWPEPVT